MSYSNIKKKLESGQVIILDGAIGGELEKVGAPMDKNLCVGKCSNDCPDLVLKVHEKYIDAGTDVITTNTYALAPISMKQYGYCLLYTSPSPRDLSTSRMPSSA